jgi:hypothetical protein
MDLIEQKDAYTDFQDECAHFPKDIWHLTRDLVTGGMSRSEAVAQGEIWTAERNMVLAEAKSCSLFSVY